MNVGGWMHACISVMYVCNACVYMCMYVCVKNATHGEIKITMIRDK